jgi:hypothetical protein
VLTRAVSRRITACCVIALTLLAGCSGEDLAKANFERTTVKAEPGSGQGNVPSAPTDEQALSLPALRSVDPCGLLHDDVVGTFTPDSEGRNSDWGTCVRDFVDAGGKPVSIMLVLGSAGIFADQATTGVEGLPLIETSSDEKTCYSVAVTRRDPDMGISVLAQHEQGGGTPCESGYLVLQSVVKQLRENPPLLPPAEERSLREVDLCGVLEAEHLKAAFEEGDVSVRPGGLNSCQYVQDDIVVHVNARIGFPVSVVEGTEEIELTEEIPAVMRPGTTDTAECDVSWNHLGRSQSEAEVVSLNYYNYSESVDVAEACEKVTALAEGLVEALP